MIFSLNIIQKSHQDHSSAILSYKEVPHPKDRGYRQKFNLVIKTANYSKQRKLFIEKIK